VVIFREGKAVLSFCPPLCHDFASRATGRKSQLSVRDVYVASEERVRKEGRGEGENGREVGFKYAKPLTLC